MKALKYIFSILLFLISSATLVAQQYELTITGYVGDGGRSCGSIRGLETIRAVYQDGSTSDFFNPRIYENRILKLDNPIYFYESNRIVRLEFHTRRRYRKWGDCKSDRRSGVLNVSRCFSRNYNFSEFGSRVSGNAVVNIKPVLSIERLNAAEDLAGYEDPLTVVATEGFNSSIYQWQYQLEGDVNWANITRQGPIQYPHILEFVPQNYFPSPQDVIGKKVLFRILPCDNKQSNVVNFEIRRSAPHILSTVPKNVSCFDGDDGSVKLKFDRPLDANDNLSITIIDLETNNPISGLNNLSSFDENNSITINSLPPSGPLGFKIELIGGYNGMTYYTGSDTHTATFKINRPIPVDFEITSVVNVFCNDGDGNPDNNNDGEIHLSASGGETGIYEYSINNNDWIPFSNPSTHIINNLKPANYEVRVRKNINSGSVYCIAKHPGNIVGTLGEVKVETRTISQPTETLQVEYTDSKEPSANGFTDGQIVARVFGGTIFDNNTYNFEWKNSSGVVLSSTNTQFVSGQGYFITLNNIPKGTYNLTVRDKNYVASKDPNYNQGCTIVNSEFTLDQPPTLSAYIEVKSNISCNDANINNDPYSNGELIVHASGGVQLGVLDNRGLPYYYTWKKKDQNGVWQILTSETSSTISNLSHGEYAVNIQDANGILIGTYSNNVLVTETHIEQELVQPDLLEIEITKKENVFCYGGNDGSIDITIKGGTQPYDIEWNNVDWNSSVKTEDLNNLKEGTYNVAITDKNGCRAFESIQISQPEEFIVTYPSAFFQPTGFGLNDGWIEAVISGGTANVDGSYNFEWKNSNGDLLNSQVSSTIDGVNNQFIIRLEGVGRGTYNLTVTDANYIPASNKGNCGRLNLEYFLDEPAPLKLVIEEATSISCNQNNIYNDPWADGVIVAKGEGGVLLDISENNGLPYYYTWKKKDASDNWITLSENTDKLSNLSAGVYSVIIKDKNGIEKELDVPFELKEPELLKVTINTKDVLCKDGSDGWAEVILEGGTGNEEDYEIFWSTGEKTKRIEGLIAGTYSVIVTDKNGCNAEAEENIGEPLQPINITYTAYNKPTSIGASDAWIEAIVSGGTPFSDDSYLFDWTNDELENLNSNATSSIINIEGEIFYQIRLQNIPAGTYSLTIKDKSFNVSSSNEGCSAIEDFTIQEPIEATISVLTPISCNQNNEFTDPFSNGELIVSVEGGVPFSSGQLYNYHWKKQDENGNFQPLPEFTTNIASGLAEGNYAVNVEDSMGNVIGVYEGDNLIQAIDETFYFQEPDLIELELSSTPISCGSGNDGSATVKIKGGVGNYKIEWSNGEATATIKNLIAGSYFVYVTDDRGCQATGKIEIGQPGGINIETEVKNPTCNGSNDGFISVKVSGGTGPYKYLWKNTNNTTSTINNITEGTYFLEITDAEGCKTFIEKTLTNPESIIVDLGEDRTLCFNQSLSLDITIEDEGASYLWESDNGFKSTSATVELTEEGIYKATVTTSLGCISYDEIQLNISDEHIDSYFLLNTQAFVGDEIILVNVSNPISEKVEWTLPEGVKLIYETNEKIIVSFDAVGSYNINLRSFQGDCYADFDKNIVVEEATEFQDIGDANNPFIEEFLVYPNPSDGNFKVKLVLGEEADISVKIISLALSQIVHERQEGNARDYLLDYSLNITPGLYVLLLETPKGDEVRKLIIK